MSLECKVVGIPSPTLRWYKDGEEIRSGDVLALTPNMEKPVSVYRCDAVNCMGTISSTSVLDVSKTLNSQTKSPPALTETLTDKKVKIGELVELGITGDLLVLYPVTEMVTETGDISPSPDITVTFLPRSFVIR